MLTVDGFTPSYTFGPANISELREFLAQADKDNKAITPTGSGTKLAWGNLPSKLDYLLQTSHFNRIVNYEPADLTVSVEAGCKLSTLQKALREHGQFLPVDPPYGDEATIGGIVACDSTGPLRFRYGRLRDMVIGMKVAHANGEVSKAGSRVVKNVSGYDLCKLYTGSYGTLGIIIEVNFKLQPLQESDATCIVCFRAVQEALDGVDKILNSQLTPSALELVDSNTLNVVQPELSIAQSGFALLLRFTDITRAVDWEVNQITKQLFPGKESYVESLDKNQVWNKIVSLDKHLRLEAKILITLKSSAPLNALVDVYEGTTDTARSLNYTPFTVSHVGNGIIYTYLVGDHFDETCRQRLTGAINRIRDLTTKHNGSTVVLTAPPSLKEQLDVWGFDRQSLALMKAIKSKFDPKGIFNPGRFVGRI